MGIRVDEHLKLATEKVHDAGLARALLTNPLVQEFFISERERITGMFKRLPIGSPLEAYQFIHAYWLAIDSIESSLKSSLAMGDIAQKNIQATDNMEADNSAAHDDGQDKADPFSGWFKEEK